MSRLTTRERARLPRNDFGIPSQRKYPIENKSHARDALSRVSHYGTPREKKEVRRAVKRKFPSIEQMKGLM